MKNGLIRLLFSFCFVIFLSVCLLHNVCALNLDEVQQAIRESGAKWTAGENPISNLPLEDIKRMAGTFITDTEYEDTNVPGVEELPTRFDWRDNDGNWVTSVKDQSACGSCWAFAAVGALESLALITAETPDPPGSVDLIDLSEQFLVSCSKLNHGCYGGYMAVTYGFLRWFGTPDEDCFPYQAEDIACALRCPDWKSRRTKISGWSWVIRNVNAIKAAVYKCPVSTGFNIYEDFYYYTEGVYEYTTGDFLGGHAVVIVGWDDDPPEGISCFIVKNSWDTGWGEDGYFRIGYSQLRNDVKFGSGTGKLEMEDSFLAPSLHGEVETTATRWGEIKDSSK
jgi:C1A family cysteine protease